jgi:ATP synthase protein I
MKKSDTDKFIKRMANASSVGTSLAFSILIGAGLGWWLDKVFDTKPWLFLIFMVLGIIAGFKNMIYFIKKTNLYDNEDTK